VISLLSDSALKSAYDNDFQRYCAEPWAIEWRRRYLELVTRVQNADLKTWVAPAFQRQLWEETAVAEIGLGKSVTVIEAYTDTALAQRLYEARQLPPSLDPSERGQRMQALFEEILSAVYPRYTNRRPKARIVRLLATLFPHDVCCLMDANRLWSVQRIIGAPRIPGGFVAQHPVVRHHLRTVLGEAKDLAGQIDQAVFTWFLWQTYVDRLDEGAIAITAAPRAANDVPPFSLLPANAQRRSLTSVRGNISLLVSIVREAEQGLSREDLIGVILQEAPYLQASSAPIIISQAQGGLGLIHLKDGAYYPTDRGIELLNANEPAHVLRAPLIGRVFGTGQLLRRLAQTPEGATREEMATFVQSLVPSWKTKQPASFVIQWAILTGLVRVETVAGSSRLFLTEDGEDYAAALPDDFEERWRVMESDGAATIGMDDEHDTLNDDSTETAAESYDIADIVAEGCFVSQPELEAALALLRSKKNIVLQGPPGTGKTWLARRLGYALIGSRDRARVTAVQFQPSLSYEDFVRGWRPDGRGSLTLADGVFLEIVAQAKADPNQSFVLVIEEINRGNPAQIFGELLTLLEADKRTPTEALRLAYPRSPDERVYVPPNLFVIGTMNLADRSLALVDLALRRRFAFLTLKPAIGRAWRTWCLDLGAPRDLIDIIAARVEALNEVIRSAKSLGEQFCVGHSYVTPPRSLAHKPSEAWQNWYREVVRAEIKPLLSEYWYDDESTAEREATKLLQGV